MGRPGLFVMVLLVSWPLARPPAAGGQEAYTPAMARDQLTSVLEDLGDWYGLATSRYGRSAWSLEGENGSDLTLLAQTDAVAGHEVRLVFSPVTPTDEEGSGYRVRLTDPQGAAQFDLHLHAGDAGQGHLPVLCPEATAPDRPMGCLDIHGSGSGRSIEAAWSSNGEMRWLVAYRNGANEVDSVLAVGRARVDRTFQRVVLSLSGGISYGSYQAGVNWAMVDMLKRLKYGELSRRTDHHDFGSLRLAAATGASAGNINALFSALEWCDRSFIPPERSLFFRTWANIGFTQLLPQARYRDHASIREDGVPVPDSALFTRRFFKAVPFREIGEKLTALSDSAARSIADCTTPIGVTLTRLLPGRLQLGLPPYEIPIETQRYTTIFRLAGSGSAQRPTVSFTQEPAVSFEDPTLGKWMELDNGGLGRGLDVNAVLGLVEAASAYPIAFAPITLRYEDPDTADCTQVREGRCLRRAQFMDGGLFDNNPLAVAFSLLRGRQTPDDPTDVSQQLRHLSDLLMNRVFYIDPGRKRGRLDPGMDQDSIIEVLGLDALTQMIKGGIPTARKYELQSVARFGSVVDQSWIRVTDRASPVFGEALGAFGAFLGRPLRVHDFYVGAYDGMRVLAGEALCNLQANAAIGFAPSLVSDMDPVPGRDSLAINRCLANALDSLITHTDSIPTHGRLIMASVYERDFPDFDISWRAGDSTTWDAHTRIARGSVAAAEAMYETSQRDACPREGRVFDLMLCREGIVAAATVLRRELSTVPHATGVGNPECEAARAAVELMAADCVADEWFVRFVGAPGVEASRFVERVLRQLWRVQNTYDPAEESSAETIIEFPEFYYRSLVEPQYRDLRWLPRIVHTLPENPEPKAWPLYAMPEEISALSQNNGWQLQFAKQAGWDLSPGWMVPLTAAYQVGFGAVEGQQVEGRLGLARKGTGLFLPRWGMGGIYGYDFTSEQPFWGAQMDLYLAAGKFHIGPRWIASRNRGWEWAPRQVTFGLSDVSGMIYWLARLGVF